MKKSLLALAGGVALLSAGECQAEPRGRIGLGELDDLLEQAACLHRVAALQRPNGLLDHLLSVYCCVSHSEIRRSVSVNVRNVLS